MSGNRLPEADLGPTREPQEPTEACGTQLAGAGLGLTAGMGLNQEANTVGHPGVT